MLQVDAIALVNRLAADEKLREQFVASASQASERASVALAAAPAPGESRAVSLDREYLAFLNDNGLIMVPRSADDWRRHWQSVNLAGLAITALLLSMGAPFWYTSLGRLLQLRSIVAGKDDLERARRQYLRIERADEATKGQPSTTAES